MRPHPFMVLPLMFIGEFAGMLCGVARDLVIVNMVCQEGGFAAGTSCDAQEVVEAAAGFQLLFTVAGAVPAFFASVPLGTFADRAGRGAVIALSNAGKLLFLIGMLAVQWGGLRKEWLLPSAVLAGMAGSTPTIIAGCLGFVVDVGAVETRSRDFVLVDTMLKLGLVLGSAAGGWLVQTGCPCLKNALAGSACSTCTLPFVVPAVLTALVVALALCWLPDSLAYRKARRQEAGAEPLLSIADGSHRNGSAEPEHRRPGGDLCGGQLLSVATATPLLLLRTLRASRGHFVVILGFACCMGGFFGFKDSAIDYFKQRFQMDSEQYGMFLSSESGWKVGWQVVFSVAATRSLCLRALCISPDGAGDAADDRARNLLLVQWCGVSAAVAYAAYVATPIFDAVFAFAALDGAGGLAAPLLRRTISGLSSDDRQGEVLAMFASIETVCQLSAGVVYNGLFELTSGFFPEAFGCLAALSELGCAACAKAFASSGKARAGYRAPLGARACDALCFAESVRAVK